jgi:LPXTG-site transpeptidase (sortase) family protein
MIGAFSILFAFLIGLAFTLWLATRQSRKVSIFQRRRKANPLWWLAGGSGVLGLGLVALAGAGWLTGHAPANLSLLEPAVEVTFPPARLLIPLLDVNEKIVAAPLADGTWDVSRLGVNIGWLPTTGGRPGDELAMVFIGHVTVSPVERGPLADLWTLPPLAEVIYRSEGADYIYAIKDIVEVNPDEVDKLYVKKSDHILLVTCTAWNYVTETYDKRLLADAVLVKQQPSP